MSEEAKIMKRLGQRLREIRMARQLSQEAYALSIEMDRTYYTAVESGRRNLSLGNLYKIATGHGLTLSQLFEGVEGAGIQRKGENDIHTKSVFVCRRLTHCGIRAK